MKSRQGRLKERIQKCKDKNKHPDKGMEDIDEDREQVKLREQSKEGKDKDKGMDSCMATSSGPRIHLQTRWRRGGGINQ